MTAATAPATDLAALTARLRAVAARRDYYAVSGRFSALTDEDAAVAEALDEELEALSDAVYEARIAAGLSGVGAVRVA